MQLQTFLDWSQDLNLSSSVQLPDLKSGLRKKIITFR